jgi:hypothetical protein
MTDLRLKLASTLPALKLQISQPSLKARVLPGTPGEDGVNATIAVGTVTTLSTGSPATVVNVGTPSNAIFDFGIPQGAPGGVTPSALTRVNDTNVTLTLGGTPATALLQAASLTLGWSGRLALSRLATGTAGYMLQGNGAGDPSYAGFVQAGTGAITRTWQEKARETVSVDDFGAVGDGATNDSAAIQAAINAVSAQGGGIVFFPHGTYLCSGLSWPNSVVLCGEGQTRDSQFSNICKLKLPNSSAAGAFIIASDTYINNSSSVNLGQSAFNLMFDGNLANQSTDATATVVCRGFASRFQNCAFTQSSGHGFLLTCKNASGGNGQGLANTEFVHCDFQDNDFAGLYCANDGLNSMADVFVRGCVFAFNGTIDDANKWRNLMSERGVGYHIIDCQMYGCPNGNILLQLAGLTSITGNNLDNGLTGDNDVNVELALSGYHQIVVSGNTFWDDDASAGAPKTHLKLTKSSPTFISISITGNTFSYTNIASPNALHVVASGFASTDHITLIGNSYFPETTIPTGAPFISGNVAFPATQVASTDPNTLDDYEEGTWTPVLTFGTPGNLSVTYSTQTGYYVKVGRVVHVWGTIFTSAFTHTTASGNMQITGLPFTSADIRAEGALRWQGITKAGYTDVIANLSIGATVVEAFAMGSGQNVSAVTATDMPTGGSVALSFDLSYLT